jgi:Flp pilus assembly protein TadD
MRKLARSSAALLVLAGMTLGCASLGPPGSPSGSLRLTELVDEGDPQRRSSMQLVLQGLDADADMRSAEARSDYGNALRVDPSNPYAYLALARHHVSGRTPERALAYLDRAESFLRVQQDLSPRVEAHLVGLRGAALMEMGRTREAKPLLDRARELDPDVWGDGRLAALELR